MNGKKKGGGGGGGGGVRGEREEIGGRERTHRSCSYLHSLLVFSVERPEVSPGGCCVWQGPGTWGGWGEEGEEEESEK